MIVQIVGSKYYQFKPVQNDDEILLVKEKDNAYDDKAIAAFNSSGEKIGYVGKRKAINQKVFSKMKRNQFRGKAYCFYPELLLVELDFPS
jgi:hypothetical protein